MDLGKIKEAIEAGQFRFEYARFRRQDGYIYGVVSGSLKVDDDSVAELILSTRYSGQDIVSPECVVIELGVDQDLWEAPEGETLASGPVVGVLHAAYRSALGQSSSTYFLREYLPKDNPDQGGST